MCINTRPGKFIKREMMRKGGFTPSHKLALFTYIKRDMMYGRPHFLWINLNSGTCSHFYWNIYFIKKVEHRWENNIWATGCTKGYCENKLACQKIDYFQASTNRHFNTIPFIYFPHFTLKSTSRDHQLLRNKEFILRALEGLLSKL